MTRTQSQREQTFMREMRNKNGLQTREQMEDIKRRYKIGQE